MESQELIHNAIKGDKEAMTNLYNISFKYVFGFIYSYIQDQTITEDLTSETFVIAFENLKNFKNKCSFRTWVCAIAKNLIRKNFLHQNKDISFEFDESTEDKNDKNIFCSKDKELFLNKILNKMPTKYSNLLKLRYLMGYNIKECAEELNISENYVRVLCNRALKFANKLVTEKDE